MQDMLSSSSLASIEFPRRTRLIKRLRYASFIMNDVILLTSFIAIILWLTDLFGIKVRFFDTLALSPFVPVLFIFSGTPLLFGAKRHLVGTQHDAEKEDGPWWSTLFPISLAGVTAIGGFINLIHLTDTGVLSLFHTSMYGGFCFFLIGLSLIPPFTHIRHRFHITQFLVFIVSGLNVFVVLESIYQLFSPLAVQHILQVPLIVAFVFVFFCFGILLRWSNRGFFGNFTLDSTVSTFALRLVLINLFSGPLIAFLVLFTTQKSPYNLYQVITIIVALSTSIASILLWINVKLLYRYDLEHILMRESLRAHNIDLTAEEEALRKRIARVEQEKQQYLDKLSSENILQDVVDTSE